MKKYNSFCVTVRPSNGVAPGSKLENEILIYLKKKVDYYFICSEMSETARHLHIQLWYKSPLTRGQCVTAFDRILTRTIDYDMNQKKVQHKGVKIAYSDWYLSYLSDNELKDEDCNILANNPPENSLEFYPTEEEQEELVEQCNAIDKKYHILMVEYFKWKEKNKIPHNILYYVASFLNNYMFIEKKMCVISEKKRRVELCKSLLAYINGNTGSYEEFLSNEDKDIVRLDLEGKIYSRYTIN